MNHTPKIGIVVSEFNRNITQLLQEGALQQLKEKNIIIPKEQLFLVPGAVELPLIAAALAAQKTYDAVICLGSVIQGESDHYDYVCWQVSYGCQKVALEYNIPVIFGVLTTQNEQQAYDRCGGLHGHKGKEAADAALQMINVMNTVRKNTEYAQPVTHLSGAYRDAMSEQ